MMLQFLQTKNQCQPTLLDVDRYQATQTLHKPTMSTDTNTVSIDTNLVQTCRFSRTRFQLQKKAINPKVPFPKSPRKSNKELDDARCKAMMDKLIIEMPLIYDLMFSPMIRQYAKRMVTKDLNTKQGVMTISSQVSNIIKNKIPPKLSDPGSFVLN